MTQRLSLMAAAFVIARRDFTAILLSRSFLFFLLGPLFPVIVGVLAGGVGQRVQESVEPPALGIAMQGDHAAAMLAARRTLAMKLGADIPDLIVVQRLRPGETVDANGIVAQGDYAAVLTGTLAAPVLTGPPERIERWRGMVSLLAAESIARTPQSYPQVTLAPTAIDTGGGRRGLLITAQASQTLLFLLTVLLAGMVLSNLVEEKANKIIEILAAAVPMDAVFFGKLFAMLGISFVGIATWGVAGGALLLAAGSPLEGVPTPAVGWPVFLILGVVYFAMAYLLLGSIFLAIGSLATTVREVQTLSMPATMMQLLVFFLAGFAMTQPGSPIELAAVAFPFSSPFAMIARAAQDPALWPHLAAICWQVVCVVVLVRLGARLFRSRVMKSGPAHKVGRGPVARLRAALTSARAARS